MFLVSLEEFRAPKFLIAEKIVLGGASTGVSEPLHIVGFPDVIERGIIQGRMRRRCRDDGGEMRRKFFGGRPLIKASIGTTPHRDLAVAERLSCKPLDNVVAIARFICERLKLTTGISAAANIDKRECITV